MAGFQKGQIRPLRPLLPLSDGIAMFSDAIIALFIFIIIIVFSIFQVVPNCGICRCGRSNRGAKRLYATLRTLMGSMLASQSSGANIPWHL